MTLHPYLVQHRTAQQAGTIDPHAWEVIEAETPAQALYRALTTLPAGAFRVLVGRRDGVGRVEAETWLVKVGACS